MAKLLQGHSRVVAELTICFLYNSPIQGLGCKKYRSKLRIFRSFVPTRGNNATGRFFLDADCGVTLELFSNNTLLFKTAEKIGFRPDSAVMVRTDSDSPLFK